LPQINAGRQGSPACTVDRPCAQKLSSLTTREITTVQRGQNATSNSRHCPRRTPIRERRTRLRARTPACAQARHEVAVNFTTDRTVPRHCSGRGYDVKFGQGTGGDGKGLRPRGVEPHSPSDCFTREVSVTFHHWPGFPRKSARDSPRPGKLARRATVKLGESATAVCRCQGEGTAVFTTQRAFILLALR